MDFLDPRKKRAYRIRLYIGYVLMAVALSIGTLILLFEAYGYDVNHKTGEVIQNGLVFVDSRPESARIFVNGKSEGNTDARFVLPADEYTIRLERQGYRPWQRTLELEGSVVERLTYPFIFPESLAPEDSKQYDTPPPFATQSPDRRWLLVQRPGGLNQFDVVDLNNEENPTTTIEIPDGLLTAAPGDHKLTLTEWSTNNRHVLLNHSFQTADGGSGFEFIMVDREAPAESFNVNRTFANRPLSQVALRDKKFDQLYLVDNNKSLYQGEVATGETSLLANTVQSFKSYGSDTILYVTEDGAPAEKAFALVRRGDDTYKLSEVPRSSRYVVDLAKYSNRWYMVVGTDKEQRALIYRNPFDDIARKDPRLAAPVAVLRLEDLHYVSFSANAQFIGAQGGSEFSVYDAEHDRQYRYDTGLALSPEYRAVWMDGYRYMVISDGQAVVFDYDGINLQRLTTSDGAFLPYFNRDYDYLYTISASVGDDKERSALIRTPMRTPQDL